MKYFVVGLIVLLIVTLPGQVTAQRDPKQDINLEITAWSPVIASYQNTYAGVRGRYYQMLWTHSQPPADGREENPDRLTDGPTDQPERTIDLWQARGDPTSIYRMRIDTYSGPFGAGYVTYFQVEIAGQLWERAENSGPETQKGYDWQIVQRD